MIARADVRYKSWEIWVTIDGRRYRATGLPSRTLGLNQQRSAISIELEEMPPLSAAGKALTVDIAANGRRRRFFTGYAAPDSIGANPYTRTLNGVDLLYRLHRTLNTPNGLTWSNISWLSAVDALLNAAGVSASERDAAFDPGALYVIAPIRPIVIAPGDNLAAVFQELLAFAGAAAFALPSGKLRIVDADRRPQQSSNLKYSSVESDTDAYRFFNVRRVIGPFETAVNAVTASGPALGLSAAPEATYTVNAPGKAVRFTSRFIQTGEQAMAIAERECRRRARSERTVTLEAPLDPDVLPGMSLLFRCPQADYPSYTPAYVLASRTSGATMHLELSLGPSTVDGYSSVLPPIVDFTANIVRETMDGVAVIDVMLDGSTSMSLNGADILSWQWSTDAALFATTPPQSATSGVQTQPRWCYIVAGGATSMTITLTVNDGYKTNTLTRAINLAPDAVISTRQALQAAFGAAWHVTPDGGATWRTEVNQGDAVACAPFGAGATNISSPGSAGEYGIAATGGTGATRIRTSVDLLESAGVLQASLPAMITMVWQNERHPQRLWAVAGQNVYRSVDGGATFVEWGTPLPGSNPTWVQEDPYVENSVFVLVGRYMMHSTSPTPPRTSWAILFTGPENAVARTMVRGKSGALTWVAFTGAFNGSPLQRVEGGVSAIFPVVSPAVRQIRALALADSDTPALYAWDDHGRCFEVDARSGSATQRVNGNLAAGETAQHAVHDLNHPIVYLATFGPGRGSVKKYLTIIDRLLTFRTGASGQQAHMVGLAAKFTRVNARIVAGSWGGAGARAIMYYDPDLGWVGRGAGLPSGWYWLQVKANPFNPMEWVVLGLPAVSAPQRGVPLTRQDLPITNGRLEANGQSLVWRTVDAGATWTPVWIVMPNNYASPEPAARNVVRDAHIEFSPASAGRLIMAFLYPIGNSGATQNMRVGIVDAPIAGTMQAVGMPLTAGASTNGANAFIDAFFIGEHGDIVLHIWASHWPATNVTKAAGAAGWAAEVRATAYGDIISTDALPSSRAAFHPASYTPDYRRHPFGAGAWPTSMIGTPVHVAALADERYFVVTAAGGTRQDYRIYQVVNPMSRRPVVTESRAMVHFYDGIRLFRAGRQTRRAIAARIGDRFNADMNNLTLVYDGARWANLAGPAGVTLSYGVEVLDHE